MQTTSDALSLAEQMHSEEIAFICEDRQRTFTEFFDRCHRVGSVLNELGVSEGQRVAIWAANSEIYAELYLAIPSHGREIMPLNTRWAFSELEYALEDGEANLLITDRDPGPLSKNVEQIISIAEYEELIQNSEPLPFVDVSEDALLGLFYTGGTTGKSKGVMLTHRNILANTVHCQIMMPLSAEDKYLLAAPMFHAAGTLSVLQCIALGAAQIIVPTFDPNVCLDLIEMERCTSTLLVPTMIAAMVEAQAKNPRSLDTMTLLAHGASPISTEVLRKACEQIPNAEFIHIYGATETAPLVTGLRSEQLLIDTPLGKSVGRPTLGVSIKIDADQGQPGEVLVKGPNVTSGYWNKPEQTAEVIQGDWYRTGDVGYLDHGGNLFLVDRAKDMIISGGENIYCSEVEEVIYQNPKILEATVFGIPHPVWGEQVHATVVPRDTSLTESELIDFCRTSLAGYKLPRSIAFQEKELPKSGPGKVLKRELRAPYWVGHERSIN